MKRLMRLSPADNVAVALEPISAGEIAECDRQSVRVNQRVGLGHKVALCPIASGCKVLKFGCPIGSATSDIAAGDYVHNHNLKSDYLPTYTLEEGHRFVDQSRNTA
jgi:hypothetical protein